MVKVTSGNIKDLSKMSKWDRYNFGKNKLNDQTMNLNLDVQMISSIIGKKHALRKVISEFKNS